MSMQVGNARAHVHALHLCQLSHQCTRLLLTHTLEGDIGLRVHPHVRAGRTHAHVCAGERFRGLPYIANVLALF